MTFKEFFDILFEGQICPQCKEHRTGHWRKKWYIIMEERTHICASCNGENWRQHHQWQAEVERENRISEQTEALRRAFPQGPYR